MCCPLSLSLSLSVAQSLYARCFGYCCCSLLRLGSAAFAIALSTRLGSAALATALSLNSALLSQLRSLAAPFDWFSRHAAVEPVIT